MRSNLNAIWSSVTSLEGSGTDKELWISEIGWNTASVSENAEADNVDTAINLLRNDSRAIMTSWFCLRDFGDTNKWGLERSDASKKPGWYRFQAQAGVQPTPTVTNTPVPTDTPSGTTSNLSLCSAKWDASSWYSANEIGLKAFDDVISGNSKWCSDGQSAESWLALDLGAVHEITHITVQHAGAGGEPTYYNTQAYRLESGTSLSGGWNTIATVNNSSQQNVTTSYFDPNVNTRYVRLYITDAGSDNHAPVSRLKRFTWIVRIGHGHLLFSGNPKTFAASDVLKLDASFATS